MIDTIIRVVCIAGLVGIAIAAIKSKPSGQRRINNGRPGRRIR